MTPGTPDRQNGVLLEGERWKSDFCVDTQHVCHVVTRSPCQRLGGMSDMPPVFSFPINQSAGPACMAARPGPLQRGVLSCVPTAFPPRLVEDVTEGSGSPGHPDEPCPVVIPQAAC